MNVQSGDLWHFHRMGHTVVIPTNEMIRNTLPPQAVMGGGLALQAAQRMPSLPRIYGDFLDTMGRKSYGFLWVPSLKVICLPTKADWRNDSILSYIVTGCKRLRSLIQNNSDLLIATPILGCGLGNLDIRDVYPVMVEHLDHPRISIITQEK